MAAADPPAGLMDIVSTLSPDDIPFKLRCAICSKLAVNAFRLPCCDQSICETCQTSLTDTCPVCAHTPVSPDLCKPNKALRTTLKAFLRTEEKKREKERQSAAPATPTFPTPAESEQTPAETPVEQTSADVPAENAEALPVEIKSDEAAPEVSVTDTPAENRLNGDTVESGEPTAQVAEPEPNGDVPMAVSIEADATSVNGDVVEDESALSAPNSGTWANMMNIGSGGFPMGWNGNPMNSFMGNGMFNFPNQMGMPMTMDPMAANQGMYGMNMTGMGMNMGMNYNGQGMYGSLAWDGSQQNMWQGGQDNFNPNAFANGTGPPYGGAFGGSNMSYHSNPDFQPGSGHGSGYGRGFRGRGRGYFGPGRGGFGGPANQPYLNQSNSNDCPDGVPGTDGSDQVNGNGEHVSENPDGAETNAEQNSGDANGPQLQGIPTIDTLDLSTSTGSNGFQGPVGLGYGRGGYMRGAGRGYWGGPTGSYQPQMEQPRGVGVEGAPAAPRAMREGLPNTSVFRHRGGFHQARGSGGVSTPGHQRVVSGSRKDSAEPRSPSKAPSQPPRSGSRSRSPSQSRVSHAHSPEDNGMNGDRESHRKYDVRRADHDRVNRLDGRRSRSQSRVSSRRSSRPRHREGDRERRGDHRPHRSRRHGHSPSPSRNGEGNPERVNAIKEHEAIDRKTPSEAGDLAGRISSDRFGKERSSRREDDRDKPRDNRRRDRDRDRDRRDRRDRDRSRDRDQGRDRDRREQGKTRERDRKRRRDRSKSPTDSRPQSRRMKRSPDEYPDLPKPKAPEPEKDPYTLEREARNRERMLREQQNRGTKSSKSSRRDRPERMVGGRPVNFKYEDEL